MPMVDPIPIVDTILGGSYIHIDPVYPNPIKYCAIAFAAGLHVYVELLTIVSETPRQETFY